MKRLSIDKKYEEKQFLQTVQVLLIEDNADDVLLTKLAFQKAGVETEITVLNNGEDAVNYLSRYTGKEEICFDLILLDINLPRISGLEVLKKIKSDKNYSSVPVMVFTSSDSIYDMGYCYGSGADLYVKKPNNIGDFRALIIDFMELRFRLKS